MKGLFATTLDWITHPAYSESELSVWVAFLMGVLVLSFLWTTVLNQIE